MTGYDNWLARLGRNEIDLAVPEGIRMPFTKPLLVDEWIAANPRTEVNFSGAEPWIHSPPGLIKCRLDAIHNGNRVVAQGYAFSTGEAFLSAVFQIEKTIGDWRRRPGT